MWLWYIRRGNTTPTLNFGFCILGRLIEKVTGVAYEQHMHDVILKQRGVTDMRIAGNTLAKRAGSRR
jgi:CubicO group peptidase (beta-lactamase class C family)